MRKIIIFMAVLLIFCGCSKNEKVRADEISKAFKNGFSARVTVLCGEDEIEMTLLKNGTSISFFAEKPAELKGLSIVLFDEHAKVNFEGMELSLQTEKLPEKAPFLLLEKLFKNLENPAEENPSTDENSVLINEKDFFARLSKKDFSAESAIFPEYKTEFSFSEWEFLPPK